MALRAAWGARAASVGYGVTLPGPRVRPGSAMALEMLMTALLLLVIFTFLSSRRTNRWTPLAVLVTVALEVWQGAPYTGTSPNPARSLAPAVVAGHFTDWWVYLAGPLGGSLLAAVLWAQVPRVVLTAKLFHDPRYRSTLGSVLPARGG